MVAWWHSGRSEANFSPILGWKTELYPNIKVTRTWQQQQSKIHSGISVYNNSCDWLMSYTQFSACPVMQTCTDVKKCKKKKDTWFFCRSHSHQTIYFHQGMTYLPIKPINPLINQYRPINQIGHREISITRVNGSYFFMGERPSVRYDLL